MTCRHNTPLRIRQISEQPGGERLIGVDARSDGHPDQPIQAVRHASSQDLLVAAPRPHLLGQGPLAESPSPAKVAWVKLDRHTVLLPYRQRLDDLIQRFRRRGLQSNRHTPIKPDATATAHMVCVTTEPPLTPTTASGSAIERANTNRKGCRTRARSRRCSRRWSTSPTDVKRQRRPGRRGNGR